MVTKTLTITEDAYNILKGLKYENESFSEVIMRIGKDKEGVLDKFLGIIKSTPEETEAMLKQIKKGREAFSKSLKERNANY